MTLGDCMANQRVFGLQIKDVKLVDAGGHQQKGPFMHLGCQRLVFKQLEKFIFKHHSTLSGGDIFTNFKQALVGHRHMPLLHVVQHVFNTLAYALALRGNSFLYGLGIHRHEVAGR